ncbi:hypothetical protein [Streptomyces harbinensis]|uniref:Uncharacterized protein n=1 Tax=Streptomyces harbinensis TaxID=1176198 RepID=A0A1I6SPS2_9ACTN|nr:hypothetical protein [Streptomyces harbinensis]SFS78927.1 hypothetical protein SAMN05444716_10468 [Streptomyces harbinensis]
MGQRQQHRATHSARDHALAVLRARNSALALALLPAAVAVVLFAAGPDVPDAVRWPVAGVAVAVIAVAAAVGVLIARARPAVTPTIDVSEADAPALHGLIRDLADRLAVPHPGGIALTPDCDSWLEEQPRTRDTGGPHALAGSDTRAPVLVIGSPFLWWMRVGELRALLAPVVAGTGPSAHPDIAAARRCVRSWDATAGLAAGAWPPRHPLLALSGAVSRLLLRAAGTHAAEMERGVAAAASARAHSVDHGVRTAAQEQVGLAYAGWDRLLTKVALPAWRMGRWPRRLNAGVVSALTELSRRDRLAAQGFASRLGERPACDLLEEPGRVDEEISLLAARLFHGGPGHDAAPWAPVDWTAYPEEVVDRIWRDRAARLFAALDAEETPTLARALSRLTEAAAGPGGPDALAARIGTAAEGGTDGPLPAATTGGRSGVLPPLGFPAQPPATGRELLVEHVAAAVCCATADTTGATPALDWLDGPVLRSGSPRRPTDLKRLGGCVHSLVDEADPEPLRAWLTAAGVREDKPVRLV